MNQTHTDSNKTKKFNSFSDKKEKNTFIDCIFEDHGGAMEQNVACSMKIVQQKYSIDPNFNGEPKFMKFCKKVLQSGYSNSTCPDCRFIRAIHKLMKQCLLMKH